MLNSIILCMNKNIITIKYYLATSLKRKTICTFQYLMCLFTICFLLQHKLKKNENTGLFKNYLLTSKGYSVCFNVLIKAKFKLYII